MVHHLMPAITFLQAEACEGRSTIQHRRNTHLRHAQETLRPRLVLVFVSFLLRPTYGLGVYLKGVLALSHRSDQRRVTAVSGGPMLVSTEVYSCVLGRHTCCLCGCDMQEISQQRVNSVC